MRILMISLDKSILDKDSRAARRMIEYGKTDELFIILPNKDKQSFDLSPSVHVWGTGGKSKLLQFYRLARLGKEIISAKGAVPASGWGSPAITVQDPFFIGLIGWLLKRKFKISLEVQLHGDFLSDYYKRQSASKYLLSKFIIKRADKLRVVGERIKSSLVKLKISEQKIEVKPVKSITLAMVAYSGAVDKKSDHNVLKQRDFPGHSKIFVWAGRMEPIKNLNFLIDIFQEVAKKKPDWLLLLIGDGSEKLKLKERVDTLCLVNNIVFIQWVHNPFVYIKNCDCLLFPSLSEGYGLAAMEAHTAGTPVIMNDVGAANYELKPSEKVKIIPVSDKEAWIKAILEV